MAPGWALLLALSGCMAYELGAGDVRDPNQDDDDWSDDDASDDDVSDDDGCVIVGTLPVDGDPTVYYRESLQVFFEEPVSAANVHLEDDLATVPGVMTLSEDGLTASFDPFGIDPDTHLQQLTAYHAHVDAPGCSADWTFTTSDLGLDLQGNVVLEGARYLVELDQASLAEPPGLAPLLGPLGLEPFLLTVDEIGEDLLSLKAGGMTLDGYGDPIQDPCTVTVDLTQITPAELDGAHLTLAPTDLSLTVAVGVHLPVLDVSVEAEFTPSGDQIEEGRIEGWIEGSALDLSLTALGGEPGEGTCQTLSQLGSPCEACPGSPEQLTCIHLVFEEVRGELVGIYDGLDEIGEEDLNDCGK